MSKLKLNRATARTEETAANPYRFPVEAARRLGAEEEGAAGPGRCADPRAGGVDMINEIERALDRMQDRLEDLSDQIGSLRFPGVGGEDEDPDLGPSAA